MNREDIPLGLETQPELWVGAAIKTFAFVSKLLHFIQRLAQPFNSFGEYFRRTCVAETKVIRQLEIFSGHDGGVVFLSQPLGKFLDPAALQPRKNDSAEFGWASFQ